MKKTKRPLERIYLTAFGRDTSDKGIVYTFIALDDFSEFLFMPSVEKELNHQSLLKSVFNLVNSPDFNKALNGNFTLIMPFGEDIIDQIQLIIKPLNGKVIFDEKLVALKTKPVLKAFEKFE